MTTIYAIDESGRYIGAFVGIDPPEGAVIVPTAPDDARQTWNGEGWSPIPDPVPSVITRRQCARELFARSMITGTEAIAMTQTGTPPAVVQTVFDAMPEPDKTLAVIDFASDTYARDNPLLIAIMTATGADEAAIDDFFRAASTH